MRWKIHKVFRAVAKLIRGELGRRACEKGVLPISAVISASSQRFMLNGALFFADER